MIPEEFPVLTASDILIDPENYHTDEFNPDSPSTTVGWLHILFLYGYCKSITFSEANYKEFNKVVILFKELNGVSRKLSLELWEDKSTKTVQAAALNKLRIKMGYTEEYYR